MLSGYTQTEVSYVGSNVGGANPLSTLVVDSGGNLFGTTSTGGAYGAGTIFEIANGSGKLTTLVSFDGADGSDPCSGLTMDSSGNLFGTTCGGGAYMDGGTVYEIASGTSSITTIALFTGADGYNPYAGVTLDSVGDIFGTTEYGGTGSGAYGTVFEIASGSNTITSVATFNGTNGSSPKGGVALDSAGDIYGTTYPAGGGGTIFEIASGSNTITTLVTFDGSNVAQAAPIVTADGTVLGTTTEGANNDGAVYEFTTADPFVQTLASFNGTNGRAPLGTLTFDGSGNLYGTTSAGGTSGDGTVFSIPYRSNVITDIASFKGTNGLCPEAGIAFDASGDIFGTTYMGGANSSGTVFEVAKGSNQATSVASFQTYGHDLENSGVARDAAGNLYGTTAYGGLYADGTVFQIPNGSSGMTILASFNGTDGANPFGAVTLDQAGNLYGTTTAGGTGNTGTIFEIPRGSNSVTTLASFGLLRYSQYPLTLDSSGDLYGTSMYGGAGNLGTVFELPKGSNAVTILASFGNFLNNGNPWAGVTLDAAGDLFGTTTVGGFGANGTVFEIVKGTNTIKTIASFPSISADGQTPEGPVVLDPSGNLYGTTSRGGANNNGTVYEIAHGSSTVTALDSFTSTTGDDSRAGLTLDLAGNLYGTTYGKTGGPSTVFEIPHGSTTITRLVGFNIFDGAAAAASLTLDPLGNLYGTTYGGGVTPIEQGTVFELSTNSSVALQLKDGPNPSDGTQPVSFTATVSGGVPDGEIVTLVDTSNNNAVVASGTLSGGSASLVVPAGTLLAGTHNLVAVYGGDANYGASESAPYTQTVQVAVTSVAINGDIPALAGVQRSMVEDIVYTFNAPVNIADANEAFAVSVAGSRGTAPSTLIATVVPSSNNTQWAVSLTGQADGVLASIANGEYSISINPSAALSVANGTALAQGRTDTFYRLFGDINGDRVVNALDNARLKTALSVYNAAFDANGDGVVNAFDNAMFKQSMSVSFLSDGSATTI